MSGLCKLIRPYLLLLRLVLSQPLPPTKPSSASSTCLPPEEPLQLGQAPNSGAAAAAAAAAAALQQVVAAAPEGRDAPWEAVRRRGRRRPAAQQGAGDGVGRGRGGWRRQRPQGGPGAQGRRLPPEEEPGGGGGGAASGRAQGGVAAAQDQVLAAAAAAAAAAAGCGEAVLLAQVGRAVAVVDAVDLRVPGAVGGRGTGGRGCRRQGHVVAGQPEVAVVPAPVALGVPDLQTGNKETSNQSRTELPKLLDRAKSQFTRLKKLQKVTCKKPPFFLYCKV